MCLINVSFLFIYLFRFIFGCLDHAAEGEEALEQYEIRMFLGQDNHAGLNIVNPTSAGSTVTNNGNSKVVKGSSATAGSRSSGIQSEEKLLKRSNKAAKEEKKNSPSKGFGAK